MPLPRPRFTISGPQMLKLLLFMRGNQRHYCPRHYLGFVNPNGRKVPILLCILTVNLIWRGRKPFRADSKTDYWRCSLGFLIFGQKRAFIEILRNN
jgi:hypothetical protein